MPIDATYDEIRGNPASPKCKVSFARAEEFYQATEHILGWSDPADGNNAFAVIPIVRLEALLAKSRTDMPAHPVANMVESCLHLFDFILPALEYMIEQGLIHDESGTLQPLQDRRTLYDAASGIIAQHPDDPRFIATEDSWDAFDPLGAHAAIQWINVDVATPFLSTQT